VPTSVAWSIALLLNLFFPQFTIFGFWPVFFLHSAPKHFHVPGEKHFSNFFFPRRNPSASVAAPADDWDMDLYSSYIALSVGGGGGLGGWPFFLVFTGPLLSCSAWAHGLILSFGVLCDATIDDSRLPDPLAYARPRF